MSDEAEQVSSVSEINRVRHSHLASTVGWFVSFGMLALVGAWMAYILAFHRHSIVLDPAAWGQLGDFMGGVLNPVLSFLTLFILAFTIILQSRQLAATTEGLDLSRKELILSRQELVATREELARSAKAQEQSEQALRLQATAAQKSTRLATMSQLVQHYQSELESLTNRYQPADTQRKEHVKARLQILRREFDELFFDLTGEPTAAD